MLPSSFINHYDVLRIAPSSSQADIRKAFLQLIRSCHPDKITSVVSQPSTSPGSREGPRLRNDLWNTSNLDHPPRDLAELCRELIEAFQVLSDPTGRLKFDSELQRRNAQQDKRNENTGRKTSTMVSDVVDLSEFIKICTSETLTTPSDCAQQTEQEADVDSYTYECRCGGDYLITSEDMNSEIDVIECGGCSSRIQVKYKELGDDFEVGGQDS